MFQAMGTAQAKPGRQEIERVVLAELRLCEIQVTNQFYKQKTTEEGQKTWIWAPFSSLNFLWVHHFIFFSSSLHHV